jgi:hypothetical protein
METECSICREDPGSHSFDKIHETDTIIYYYTCPGKASRYSDLDGIINHKRLELSKLNGKQWVWVLDGTGFDMRHAMELQIGLGIARLLDEYSVSKVYVINPGIYISVIKSLMWPLLGEDLRGCIEFME